jgi:hypothetical protein
MGRRVPKSKSEPRSLRVPMEMSEPKLQRVPQR